MRAGQIVLWSALCFPIAAARLDCRPCHRAIYESYRRTPMAQSMGVPAQSGSFTDRSGFTYTLANSALTLAKGDLHATKRLAYAIGSGAAARSYLIEEDGFLYQAPVAYYSREQKLDLAPGYQTYGYPYLTRPIQPGCLTCHASGLHPIDGTANRYAKQPFDEAGIACARCHGDVASHDQIVNPAKLAPDRRDSVCAQCHLSGAARVYRPGADWQTYQPGDRLSDSALTFVRADTAPGMTVTSHVENLAQSACKRASGEKLWCGSCHDVHTGRATCQGCHDASGCGRGPDCVGCHMPKSAVRDAQHVVYTDHSIPRRPRATTAPPDVRARLVLFGGGASTDRDLGLAFAIAGDRDHARPLLESASPDDREALAYLADIDRPHAEVLYRRVLALDRHNITALVGLGAILYERGEFNEAIPLWRDAESRSPGLVLTRTNLAMAQWRSGDSLAARTTIEHILRLSPAFPPALKLRADMVRP
jgi:hypothetical protein